MPTSRIAIDGLWRCVCPSFDVVTLQLPLRNFRLRPHINRRHRGLSNPVTRSLHSEGTIKRIPSTPPQSYQALVPEKTVLHQLNASLSPSEDDQVFTQLHHVPKDHLHDVLRKIRTEEDSFDKISNLVRYLIKARGERPTLLHYESLIRANSDASHGSATAVAELLDDMRELGIAPDSAVYHSVLQALAVHPDYLLRNMVLKEMRDSWFGLTSDGWHNVLVGLLRERQYEIALDKLQQMEGEGLRVKGWLYDIFIYVLCEVEELDEALRLLHHRVDAGDADISANVWHYMLDACCSQLHYPGGLFIWRQRVSSSYYIPSDGICTAVLNTAAQAGDSDLAMDVVRVLVQRTSKLEVHQYEALLAAYMGTGDLKTAFRILSIMKKAQLEPSEGATRPIFSFLIGEEKNKGINRATSQTTTPYDAWNILQELHGDGHQIPVAAANVILSAASMSPSYPIASTMELYKGLHKICSDGPNTATFNILLQGYSKASEHGTSSKADAMFLASEMVALNIRADKLTYDRLILICLGKSDNDAEDAEAFEDAMKYVDEARATFGLPLPHSDDPTQSEANFQAKHRKGAPLRTGTWNALIKRCAERGDERVWALLEEMEELGFSSQRLKRAVEDRWRSTHDKLERVKSANGWLQDRNEAEWTLPSEM